jgi:mono/diheme cytochrome c family protein
MRTVGLLMPALLAVSLGAQQPAPAGKPTAEAMAHVKKVYGYDCAMCHGAAGDGKGELVGDMKLTLKDYTDAAALQGMTDAQMFDVIKNGKGQMPGEGPRLKDSDTWAMVYLVRSFANK